MPAPEYRTLTMQSRLFSHKALSLARWLTLLGTCTAPLLAQAESCPSGDNTDDQYILGEADGVASAMHWPTGLVWKRCLEGQTWNTGTQTCEGTAETRRWNEWMDEYMPRSFAGQDAWWETVESYTPNPSAGPQNVDRVRDGHWRMAYRYELGKITEGCDNNPKVNRMVFPDTPSSHFWSGSPLAGNSGSVWIVNFNFGSTYLSYRSDDHHARLVRGGQSFAALTSPSAQTVSAGDSATFPAFTLAPSVPAGEAWGGARISGDGNPEFQLNGTGGWVQEAIVKSGDQIAVRFNAPDSGSRTVTFTLRSGQTTGTSDNASNVGNETTTMQETSASFTALARRTDLSLQLPAGPHSGDTLDLTVTGSEWHLDSAQSLTAASLATALPPRMTLPHGAVSFRLTDGTPGSNTTVVLTYPEDLPAGTRYYKYGPTADNPTDHWYAYPGAVISGNTITLTLTDGGAGDSDLSVNGIIDDPGGPAWITQDVAPIPTLPQWAMMLLAGIMGMLALNRVRVRNT
ncbi:IPTL-CTERM sorting domain-containing protein [Marinobacterium sp. BA1]|uniref:IPTL-CTERM sorting domain-containing protein n=1 Tax=Marinobacterium sp. BA1 TaxID=3138931 RepID=UPI0032E71303